MFTRGNDPTPKMFRHFRGHRGRINSIYFHPFDSTVLTAGSEGHIFLWDYANPNKRAIRFDGHESSVNDVTFNTNGDLMISGSDDRLIGVWVPLIRGAHRFLRGHSASVRSVDFNPVSNGYFISASDDKTVKLWNLDWSKSNRKTSVKSHDFVGSWCSHTNWVRSVRFNSTGTQAITASDDRTVNILDTRISEEALKLNIGKGTPVHAEFNPTSSNYFGVATTEEFHLYDIRTGKLVQCYLGIHTKDITKFSFHPSGDFGITASEDRSIKIMDLVEGRSIFTLFGHNTGVTSVSASHDGLLLGSGGRDKSLLIWKPVFIPYSRSELQGIGDPSKEGISKDKKPISPGVTQSNEQSDGTDTLTEDVVVKPKAKGMRVIPGPSSSLRSRNTLERLRK